MPKRVGGDVAHLLSAVKRVLESGSTLNSEHCALMSYIQRGYLPLVKALALGRCSEHERDSLRIRFESFEAISSSDRPLLVRELPIDGQWVMKHFELSPSRLVGQLLNHCLEESFKTARFNEIEFYETQIEHFLRMRDE